MSKSYIKPLDTLRTVSVFFVFAEHMIYGIWGNFKPGEFGVDFFFVLSGFLITRILLSEKKIANENSVTYSKVLWNFYVRRALKIFPLYFIVLLILYIINFEGIRELIGYYLLYLVNFIAPLTGITKVPAAHFWSLAVEEQFYLVWPLLVLLISERTLKLIIACLFLVSPLIIFWPFANKFFLFSPIGCFSSLGMGAFLSFLLRSFL